MRRVPVDLGPRSYEVLVGYGVRGEVAGVVGERRRVAVVSQERVAEHWAGDVVGALLDSGARVEVFFVDDGERAKTLATVEDLCRRFLSFGLQRDDAVVTLGGGVVGDAAGFAAAVYHRGIACVHLPTTLLAQVDAAVGGKAAVNLPEGKNLVGSFHQPVGVLADLETLATLPDSEYRSGLGEVVKYGLALDPALGDLLADDHDLVLARDEAVLEEVVARCVEVKARVVAADEREETGLRATLNYGHTLAHALETVGGYEISHGEAVAVGVVFAAELARALGRVDGAVVARHREVVQALGLRAEAPPTLSPQAIMDVMARDKKARGSLVFVLLAAEGLGPVDDPDPEALDAALRAVGIEA